LQIFPRDGAGGSLKVVIDAQGLAAGAEINKLVVRIGFPTGKTGQVGYEHMFS
jgi:hypothetical protein